MHVLHALSSLLTTLPASTEPSPCAGMNFHLPRSGLALPQREVGPVLLAERANEIALEIDALSGSIDGLDGKLSSQLRAVAASLVQQP